MRNDDRYSVIFISPNGARWYVYKNSPYTQWLNLLLKGAAMKEDYVTTR